jgi:hypothetical protein
MAIKSSGYYECFEKVERARTETPVNTDELNRLRDLYGDDLYTECLQDVIRKHNLD